jgi:gliding motility-associated-like protein
MLLKQTLLMKRLSHFFVVLCFSLVNGVVFGQSYSPVSVTGFNHDIVAETGTSSLTTTTSAVDGVPASNKVIYTNAFKIANGFGGGGLPDNGLITDASGSYQLATYSGSNALMLLRNQSGNLSLATPSKFNAIRVLAFTTEGTSAVNVKLVFSDGSFTNVLTNYALSDWFNNTSNLVISGFGRCSRATPASGADGYSSNPRMYYINVPISCLDKEKNLTSLEFSNVTTVGTNAPFPNAIFLAVSGIANTKSVTASVINATCSTNGNATLSLAGVPSPYTISWNSSPIQTTPIANLSPGNYTATVTDANGCTSITPVTITLTNNLTMSAHADTLICPGSSFNANTISNAATYNWSPATGVSNISISNPILSPTATTTYTVTGNTGTCSISKSFLVTVQQTVNLTVHADTTICNGATFNANTVSNGTTFLWSPTNGLSSSNISNPSISPTITTTYSIIASTGNCNASQSFKVSVLPATIVNAGSGANILEGSPVQLQGSGSQGTYLWTPSTGLSATNILNPVARPLTTTSYTLKITNSQGCSNTSNVLVTVVPYCIKPMNAFTPNGDGFYDKWFITNGNCLIKAGVQVYNRYGSRVFESGDYKNDWDGIYKSHPLPDGTYYYVITYLLLNNTTVVKKGNVTILR